MVGVYLSVWVRKSLLHAVRGVQVTSVGTGIMGYLGNKGASVSSLAWYLYKRSDHVSYHQQPPPLPGSLQQTSSSIRQLEPHREACIVCSTRPRFEPEVDQANIVG